MKSLLYSLLLFFLMPNLVFSQVLNRTNNLGGDFSFNLKKDKSSVAESSLRSFNTAPAFGYFFSENLLAGMEISYFQKKVDSESFSVNPSLPLVNNYSLLERELAPALFLTAFMPLGTKFYLTLKTSWSLGFGGSYITELSGGESSIDFWESFDGYHSSRLALEPGIAYRFSGKTGIYAGIGGLSYRREKSESLGTVQTNSEFGLDFFPENWKFGFFVLLGSGKE